MISANIIEKVANKYSCPIILTTIDMLSNDLNIAKIDIEQIKSRKKNR